MRGEVWGILKFGGMSFLKWGKTKTFMHFLIIIFFFKKKAAMWDLGGCRCNTLISY
jgi:hypothetical protein